MRPVDGAMPNRAPSDPKYYDPLVLIIVLYEKKCQNSKHILNNSSSGILLSYVRNVNDCWTHCCRNRMFWFYSIELVVCSMRSMLDLRTALILKASYLAKVSKPLWFLELTTLLNSSRSERPFVTSTTF